MTKEEEIELLIDLYMSEKREFAKCPFLRPPKRGSANWKLFERAVEIVRELNGEISDYLRFQILALANLHLFPSPAHLASEKARNRYRIHLNMKGIYNTSLFYAVGDSFTVKASFITYPLSEVKLPFDKDPRIVYVNMVGRDNLELLPSEVEKLVNNIRYYIAKCAYHELPIPSWLAELREKYEKGN